MTRSRKRKLRRLQPLWAGMPLATALLLPASGTQAQQSDAGVLEEVVVTAQKREENLQRVPVSIQALDSAKLDELNTTDFQSYAQYLPSLSFQTYGPGQAQLYVRGVTNGGDGLHVGSLPLVGLYLDEQPVTTIGNSLDVHVYDIARVEALSGPQGTLFGASSMAGTLRIITNRPDPKAFAAGYDLELNQAGHGGTGGGVEGFVNLPIASRAAIRLVGYTEKDAGYIDNVPGPGQVYPTSGALRDNSALVKNDFNDTTTSGGRAALGIEINDRWTVTPAILYQKQTAHGTFASDPALGDLNVAHYLPERYDDRWHQASLTIEGKIGNFDLLYTGGQFHRSIHNNVDYSDYSYFYDAYYASSPSYFGGNFLDNNGDPIDPSMATISSDSFGKQSHELRIATDPANRWRLVAGAFYQRQTNHTRDEYRVANLADALSITGQPGILYMNDQERVDHDRALFGDFTFDLNDQWSVTAGLRVFDYDNT
ncbi:MAG: TonB-dependent receptor, partial [Steroidobacteraceae bacterium]